MNALYNWPLSHFASQLQRAWLCPASPHRQARVPELLSGPDAAEGTMLHAAVKRVYQDGDFSGLDDEQVHAVGSCVEFIRKIIEKDGDIVECIFESDHSLYENKTYEKIVSPKVTCDLEIIHEENKRYSIVDFKFGREKLGWGAERDFQLLTYALATHNRISLNFRHYPFRVDVYRFHPRLTHDDQVTCVTYEGCDAYWANWELVIKKIIASCTPSAAASPSEAQCRYCRAKMICQEYQGWSAPEPIPQIPVCFTRDFTPETLAGVLEMKERMGLINRMWDDAEGLAKRALAAGTPIPGWTLKPGNEVRRIKNYNEARRELIEHLPISAIDACSEIRIGALEKACCGAKGLTAEAARAFLDNILSDLVEVKQNAPSLVRSKMELTSVVNRGGIFMRGREK